MIRSIALVAGALCAAALAACTPPTAAQAPDPDQWRNIELTATPVSFGAPRVGELTFRGGLALRSTDRAFGGWSGLEVLDDGRLVAISDNGDWLAARLKLDASGALIGLDAPRIAPMRDESGNLFPDKEAGDAEDLTQLPDGRFAVSFEQTQTIRIYDFNRDGPFGAAQAGPRLAEVEHLPRNEGLEALAADSDGSLIVGAEHGDWRGHMIWRAPLSARDPVPPIARLRMSIGFGLAGFDRAPDGDFIALERFYAPVIGVRIRLATLSRAALLQGRAESREIAFLAPPRALDNFEGVATVRNPNGSVRIYLISDDNFSPRQRTLLFAFDWSPPAAHAR